MIIPNLTRDNHGYIKCGSMGVEHACEVIPPRLIIVKFANLFASSYYILKLPDLVLNPSQALWKEIFMEQEGAFPFLN